jgi:hypothetical protein
MWLDKVDYYTRHPTVLKPVAQKAAEHAVATRDAEFTIEVGGTIYIIDNLDNRVTIRDSNGTILGLWMYWVDRGQIETDLD